MSTAPAQPVLASAARGGRTRWLVLPGWGQQGAHWAACARWLARDGVELWWTDLAQVAARTGGPRGGLARLRGTAEHVTRAVAALDAGVVVAHSAAAVVAVAAHAAGAAVRVSLVEPVPAHLGVAGAAPVGAPQHGDVAELAALYPFAADGTLRRLGAATGRTHERALPARDLAPAGGTDPERLQWLRSVLPDLAGHVHAVRGEASASCTADAWEALRRVLPPGTPLETVARAGHSPHLDQPQGLARLLVAAHAAADGDRVRVGADARGAS